MLTMAYFHPWTLRQQDEERSYVPYACSLRASDSTWQDALSQWLDGRVISQESVHSAYQFLSVYCVRPREPSEDVLSDEDLGDEELVLEETCLAEASKTRVGGREPGAESKANSRQQGKATHE